MKLDIARMIKKYSVVIIGCVIIIFPLLSPGYIMSFDMAWGPNHPAPSSMLNYSLLFTAIDILSSTFGWLTQKIILIAIILLIGLGAYKTIETLMPKCSPLVYTFAGLLYLYNPFVYTRLITGQWLVLAGYALLPWAIRSIFLFLKQPRFGTTWPVIIWLSAISFTSMHTIGIVALVGIVMIIYSGKKLWKDKLKYVGLITLIWCIINAIWLIPFIKGESSASQDIATFSRSEMQAFATTGTVLDSPPISAALLTGFWADDTNRYILPSQLPIWWVGVFIIMSLVVLGIIQVIRRRDRLGWMFIGLGVTSWLLGIGIAWNVSAPITELLTNAVPYYNGYREPHKWLMLLAFAYTYLAASGAYWIYVRIKRYDSSWLTYGFTMALLVSPLLFSPTLAWGAAGQLSPNDYPEQWAQAKSYLNKNTDSDTKVLVLPWHMYLPINFVGRVVANPAGYYFDQKIITGNNFELHGVPDQNNSPLTTYINDELTQRSTIQTTNMSKRLSAHGISYILLLKEADWQHYSWLNTQKQLVPVVNNEKLILYKITGGTNG